MTSMVALILRLRTHSWIVLDIRTPSSIQGDASKTWGVLRSLVNSKIRRAPERRDVYAGRVLNDDGGLLGLGQRGWFSSSNRYIRNGERRETIPNRSMLSSLHFHPW